MKNEETLLPVCEQEDTTVPFVCYKSPEDAMTATNPECGQCNDEKNTLSNSLTGDVYTSEHVDNEEEDDDVGFGMCGDTNRFL